MENNFLVYKLNSAQKAKLNALTPFERKVLAECCKIPAGKTISYSELAGRIGNPNSARAVGNALAKNPLAPLIPCHRVVKSDGTIGKYSGKGGVKMKRMLLEKERCRR